MYINHCWFPSCGGRITTKNSKRCPICGWYICPKCGSCKRGCPHRDSEGYDREGFNENGIHRNGTKYDNYGFDIKGYDKDGYNIQGFNIYRYAKDGFNRDGFDGDGYNRSGYNHQGFNRDGVHKNGTIFDYEGFTVDGLDKIALQYRNYTVGTKVVHNNMVGEIIEYDPQITQPCIKIRYENNDEKQLSLRILLEKGLISIYQK